MTVHATTTANWPPLSWGERLFNDSAFFPWDRLVARSGEEGARWVADYVALGCCELTDQLTRAIGLLRKQRFQPGHEILSRVWEEISRIGPDRPDLQAVMNRWYFAAFSYYRFITSDFDGAARDLDLAQAAVEAAVRSTPMLSPLAHHCIEFQLHHARIARDQRHWEQMRRHIERIFDLAEDRAPLCCPGEGAPIYFTALDRYILGLPLLTTEERQLLRSLLDKEFRSRWMGYLARKLYALPGLLIPSP